MVAEIYAGLGAVKAAFDIAKGLKDIHDVTLRNAAVIELQEKILAAQVEQSSLIERIRELEKEMAEFERWDTEKQRYELKDVGFSCFAYMLQPEARGSEPPHFVCTNCFNKCEISLIQRAGFTYHCPRCNTTIMVAPNTFADGKIRWLD